VKECFRFHKGFIGDSEGSGCEAAASTDQEVFVAVRQSEARDFHWRDQAFDVIERSLAIEFMDTSWN
jgi:hypothetical protein